ncbi:MAG: cell wall hydrolase, partial [Sphingomonas sp.]
MHAPIALDRPVRPAAPGPWLRAITVLIALAALIGPALVVRFAPRPAPRAHRLAPTPRVVPPTEVPPVEPVAIENLAPDDARAINAAIPFSSDPVPAARPFRLDAPPVDRARAIDCLAAAELYEAGDEATGERAVAQVVLNRLRHPAFPKTVCGVVFQGSERSTGCQFTFTCDGALQRHAWSAIAWSRARLIAEAALTGAVDGKVGYATHYHTDWVVPYWSASLDKIAAVGPHLFFRWAGWWGTPGAFARRAGGSEPAIAALALYSPAHRAGVLAGDL